MIEAKTDQVKAICQILKAIQFKELATVCATDNGLRVTVEDLQCVQVNGFLQKELFQDYEISQDFVNLRECLNMYGYGNPNSSFATNPSLSISYAGHGAPLKLLMEESGMITDCSIRTVDPDELLDFGFTATNVLNKVIMKAESLKEVLADVDSIGAETVLVSVCSDRLSFDASGDFGDVEANFPSTCAVLEVFNYTEDQNSRFRTHLLKHALKAVQISSKVSLRLDRRGFLSMQLMVNLDDGACSPEEEVE